MKNRNDYQKERYELRRQRNKEFGICIYCENQAIKGKKYCECCRVKWSERAKAKRQKDKDLVYTKLGGYICSCCGEKEPLFLSIDHIDNNGNKHRKEIKTAEICRWIIKNNFPAGFQVLCMNCQAGKARNNGICPHQRKNSTRESDCTNDASL